MMNSERASVLRLGMWQTGTLCALVALAVWLPSLQNGFLWDDNLLILRNNVLHDASFLEALRQPFWAVSDHLPIGSLDYYRPVVRGAYWLEWRWFGEQPRGYHIVNCVLHIACSVMVTALIARRLQKAGFVQVMGPALLAGVLFAVHPSRVESVGWISGSTDLWMMVLILAGLLVWEPHKTWRIVLASLLLALALFAKETALVAVALLVSDAVLLRSESGTNESWKNVLRPFGVLLGVFAAALVVRFTLGPVPSRPWSIGWGMVKRLCASAGEYMGRLLMPWPISFVEGISGVARVFEKPTLVLGALGLLGCAVLFLVAWRRPSARPWLADALWFWVPLGPVLNIIPMQMSTLTANRFLYFPLIGIAALIARALVQLPPMWHKVGLALGAAMLLVSGAAVAQSQKYLTTDLALWMREAELNPDDLRAIESLGRTFLREHRIKAAAGLVERSMDLAKTDDARARMVLLWVYTQTALTPDSDQAKLISLRDFFDAIERSDSSVTVMMAGTPITLRLWPALTDDLKQRGDVGNFPASRGYMHLRTGSYDKAIEAFRQGITRDSRLPHAWRTWVRVLGIAGRWDEALGALKEAKVRFPQEPWIAQTEPIIENGAKAAAVHPATTESTLAHSQAVAALSGTMRAQALLSELDPLQDPKVFKAQVALYLATQRFESAKTLLEAGERKWPDQKEFVQKVSLEIAGKEK